jgi:hypothetical protein
VASIAVKPAIDSGETTPLSASDAAQLAAWYTRYALDRLPDDHRTFHPGVRSHLTAARAQHDAVAKLLAPEHDQVVEHRPAEPGGERSLTGTVRGLPAHGGANSIQGIVVT